MLNYGKNPFLEALKAKRIKIAYTLSGSEYEKLLKTNHTPYKLVKKEELNKMIKANHQNIVFEVSDYQTYPLSELIDGKYGLLVLLDHLYDPHNLGAIIRTGECVGIDGIIYPKNRSVSLNETVAKVSAGAIEYVKCAQVNNLVETIKYLKQQGYWVVGLDVHDAVDYDSLNYDFKVALVVGSEGVGLSDLVRKNLDYRITIPMQGKLNSLNASNATAIMLYKIFDKRRLQK